jgi:CubicO group peptidase (beta-lactamase class C family)
VSNVSGQRYEDYVAANILQPLGMTSTTLEVAKVPANRLARGYRWEDNQWKDEPLLPHGSFGAMGGMLTTIRDLSRYVGTFMSAWPPRDGRETAPIRRASLREMQQVSRSAPAVVSRTAAGATQLISSGYGFGLRVMQNCSFTHIVQHGGGLPGFGSIMQWLPQYGVGIIAFGNLTYTGWGRVTNDAFDVLGKTGGLTPRMPQPSPALVAARDSVSRLIDRWDDKLADDIAAENLFLDVSKERRRADLERVRGNLGACTPPAAFAWVENALRGGWTMTCERGTIQMSVTLAPTMPPKVQFLRVIPGSPPDTRPGDTCPP